MFKSKKKVVFNDEEYMLIIMEYINGTNIDKWFELYWLQTVNSNNIFRQLIEAFA